MTIKCEAINLESLAVAAGMMVDLWPDSKLEKEELNCQHIYKSDHETVLLAKHQDDYIGFIQLSLRSEYVEGTSTSPVAYIEGIFVKDKYRRQGVGALLVNAGAKWGLSKGALEYASDAEINNQESLLFHRKMGFKEFNRVACFAKKIN